MHFFFLVEKKTPLVDAPLPALYGIDGNDVCFQQDGAKCHTSSVTIDLLCQTFDGRLISRKGGVHWPPRNYDLTPLDYFLWRVFKENCYLYKPMTILSI